MIIGDTRLLPRGFWKTSCWAKNPQCPDSPCVCIIARITYFLFVSRFGFHCFSRYCWRFWGCTLISCVEDLASLHFARILLREQVSRFILAAVLSNLLKRPIGEMHGTASASALLSKQTSAGSLLAAYQDKVPVLENIATQLLLQIRKSVAPLYWM